MSLQNNFSIIAFLYCCSYVCLMINSYCQMLIYTNNRYNVFSDIVLDSVEMKSEVPVKYKSFCMYSTFHSVYTCMDFSLITVVVYNKLWFGN